MEAYNSWIINALEFMMNYIVPTILFLLGSALTILILILLCIMVKESFVWIIGKFKRESQVDRKLRLNK